MPSPNSRLSWCYCYQCVAWIDTKMLLLVIFLSCMAYWNAVRISMTFYFLLLPYPLSVLNIVHIAIAIDIYRVSCFIVLYSPWISNLNRPKIYLVWRFLFSFPMIGINQFFPPLWKFWNKAMCNDAVRQFQEFSFIRLYTTVNDCHDL